MKKKFFKSFTYLFLFVFLSIPAFTFAQNVINLNANNLLPKAEVFITPRSGTFLVGSTFEAPIFIDTKSSNINAISLHVNFDPSKLSIVNPSGGKSIFGIWVEPPQYDNKRGTASLAGIIPDGIVTSSGLIITMTFKVLSAGQTRVTISDQTTANLNDGLGSEILLTKTGATYTLQNRAPNGVTIFSNTHPSQDSWYNNNSPLIEWDTNPGITGFSVAFDNTAQSIPKSEMTNKEASQFFENIKDGVWYTHVKVLSKGIWGATSHFAVRIDTHPPAEFKPKVNTYKDENSDRKYMVSFFTTDTLSGVDHYEVGVVNKKNENEESPVFVETVSPYLVPVDSHGSYRVIIKAYDNAGNMRESYVDIYPGFSFVEILKKFGIYILILILLLLILELILHYMFGHHVLDKIKDAYRVLKKSYSSTEKNVEENIKVMEIAQSQPKNISEEFKIQTENIPVPPLPELMSGKEAKEPERKVEIETRLHL